MVPVPGDGITHVSSDRGAGGENGLVVELDRRGGIEVDRLGDHLGRKVARVDALHADDAPYAGKAYDTFLQGSYANDTNIYADSDVDIVIRGFRTQTDGIVLQIQATGEWWKAIEGPPSRHAL